MDTNRTSTHSFPKITLQHRSNHPKHRVGSAHCKQLATHLTIDHNEYMVYMILDLLVY